MQTQTPLTSAHETSEEVRPWVRVVMVAVLGLPQVATGLWALVSPSGWFANFPGIGPALVAAEPPFNRHLATDTGAGFLAVGVCVVVAAWGGRANLCRLAALTYAVFATPHMLYHLRHPASALTTGEQFFGTGGLATGLVAALFVLWTLRLGGRRQP